MLKPPTGPATPSKDPPKFVVPTKGQQGGLDILVFDCPQCGRRAATYELTKLQCHVCFHEFELVKELPATAAA
jgi:hypothetical protein